MRRYVSQHILLVLVMSAGATAWCLTASGPSTRGSDACRYSNQVYDSDGSLMRKKVPTYLRLMTSRFVEVVQAARGADCSGTAGVAFNGHEYFQAGKSDDPGLSALIPAIASIAGISLAATFDLTALGVVSLGILIGYAGFWSLYPDRRKRWLGAAVFLCIWLVEVRVADVYVFQVSPLLAGIPWVLYFALNRRSWSVLLSAILLAFCCSWCSLVRSGTTLLCLVFIFSLLAGRHRLQSMFLPMLLVILACFPAMIFTRLLIVRRDAALIQLGATATAVNSHPFWHSIYIGLAFIPNTEIPEYNDAVASEKVRSIDPTAAYTSEKYELILRREVWGLVKRRPMLVVENLAAKTGLVTLLALILLAPSIRFIFAERQVVWLDVAFVLTIGFSAMPAILVIPRPPYLLTFFCLALLYSLLRFCRAALSIQAGA